MKNACNQKQLQAIQTADKPRKRKNGCNHAAIFAFCVGVGCKMRSLTFM